MDKVDLKNYAKIMADDVMSGEVASITLGENTADEVVWNVYTSEDYIVTFDCDGNSYDYDFENEEELCDVIYDFFVELI